MMIYDNQTMSVCLCVCLSLSIRLSASLQSVVLQLQIKNDILQVSNLQSFFQI